MEKVINSKGDSVGKYLKELIDSKYLIGMLVKRDFLAKFKQSVLGPLWFILTPIFSSLVYLLVFGKILGAGPTNEDQGLFFLTGSILWILFSESVLTTSKVFVANTHLMGKIYFNRLTIPVASYLSLSIGFILQIAVLLVYWGYIEDFSVTAMHVGTVLFSIMLAWITIFLLGSGLGLYVASISIKYRDFNVMLEFVLRLAMYSTTAVYSLDSVPEEYKGIISNNPMTAIIELVRTSISGQFGANSIEYIFAIAASVACFLVGVVSFQRAQRYFMDTI